MPNDIIYIKISNINFKSENSGKKTNINIVLAYNVLKHIV